MHYAFSRVCQSVRHSTRVCQAGSEHVRGRIAASRSDLFLLPPLTAPAHRSTPLMHRHAPLIPATVAPLSSNRIIFAPDPNP